MLDGRHSGTGGGNHVVIGGPTPEDSPFLRRPDLLRSLVGLLAESPVALLSASRACSSVPPASIRAWTRRARIRSTNWRSPSIRFRTRDAPNHQPRGLVDRVFRHLLTDLTGNTHRTEFCIDKLYPPDAASSRLGLVELRAFEMPPHARMSLTQQLLVRALIAQFLEDIRTGSKLVPWGTALHDRFMLPHFVRTRLGGRAGGTARRRVIRSRRNGSRRTSNFAFR